jgi:hypothetical protein
LYPKASAAYGKSGNNNEVLRPFFKKALAVNLIVVLPVILLVYFIVPSLVNNFLPQYVNGIHYAQISVWGGLGFIMVGPSVVMGVLKKNRINFVLLGIMSICTYGLFFLKLLNFQNIERLIWFKNYIFIGYSVIMLIYIYFVLLKNENRSKIY